MIYIPDSSSTWRRFAPKTVVGLTFAILTLVMTYPVAFQLDSSLAQNPEWSYDAFHHTYVLWWFKRALLDLNINPANLLRIYFPHGGYYPLLLTYATVYVTGLPLVKLFSPVTTYNILFLLTFFLSGLSGYALCTYLTRNRWAGLLGGIVYAFFPSRMAHALCGHLELISTYLFPLYLLFLIRTTRQPKPSTSLFCGLTLAASLLVQPTYIPFLLVPITSVWLLYRAFVLRLKIERNALIALTVALGLALAIAAPLFWPVIHQQLEGKGTYLQDYGVVHFSADLLAPISPSSLNPVLNTLGLLPTYASRAAPPNWRIGELLTYAGIVPLTLATLAAVLHRRELGAWTLIAIIAFVLSLGPVLKVNGEIVSFIADELEIAIALPYALLTRVPLLSLNRAPSRINTTLMLALAILSAYGLAELTKHVHRKWTYVVAGTLCFITLIEFIVIWPYPTTPLQPPAYLSELARSPNRDAVLNLPAAKEDGSARRAKELALFYQTLHRHPVFGTWVQRSLAPFPNVTAFLDGLMRPSSESDIVPSPSVGTRAAIARAENIGYILLLSDYIDDSEAQAQLLATEFGPPQSANRTKITYRVDPGPMEIEELVYTLPAGQWWNVETWNERPARWISNSAELYLYSPDRRQGSLHFTALPLFDPERLQIDVNGSPITRLVIGDWIRYATPVFELQPGLNHILFYPLDGCTDFDGDPRCTGIARATSTDAKPSCIPYEQWERCLSILVQDVRFEADEPNTTPPASVILGHRVQLAGHDLAGTPAPGQDISLTLYWQALRPMTKDYIIFVHLLGPDGELLAQHDAPPLDNVYPTSKWIVGDIYTHQVTLHIPDDAPPGQYELLTGMYTYPNLIRLSVASGRPYAQDGLIWLQTVEITGQWRAN